jgi:hypothetical protein
MTTTDRLAIATEQLDVTTATVQSEGIAVDELVLVVEYVHALAEHGFEMVKLIERAIEAEPEHPARDAPEVHTSFGHAAPLFDVVMHLAGVAARALSAASGGQR